MLKTAGLLFDDSPHYIDHIAPLCATLNLPLIVCEPGIAQFCRTFYPNLNLIEIDFLDLKKRAPSTLISCYNRHFLEGALPFIDSSYHIIWLPHGHSDKGWKNKHFQALKNENLLLVYGKRMKEVLAIHGVTIPTQTVGSYRHEYYLRHRSFYQELFKKRFGTQPFILYAPTWEDSEKNGTFWDALPNLSSFAHKEFKLLIKLHPNTENRFLAEIERSKSQISSSIAFIDNFPPIYPILDQAIAYLGDRSSIGYDFLHFGRPLFFLTDKILDPIQDESAYLMQAGEQILLPQLKSSLTGLKMTPRTQDIKRLLQHTFG